MIYLKIIAGGLIAIVLVVFCFTLSQAKPSEPEELTTSQRAEIANLKDAVSEVNKKLKPSTVLTEKTLDKTASIIENAFKKRGYSEEEYRILGYVGRDGYVHFEVYITLKTFSENEIWVYEGRYRYENEAYNIKNAI